MARGRPGRLDALARRAAGGDLEAARRLVEMLEAGDRKPEPKRRSSGDEKFELEKAVQLFRDRDFSQVPQSWLELVARHVDRDEYVPMPAHGYLYVVTDGTAEEAIRGLLRPIGPVTLEEADRVVDEHGYAFFDRDDYGSDEDYVSAVRNHWTGESDDSRADLARGGWDLVGDTGFVARAFDQGNHLALGIDGGGYSLMDEHWIPLYRALGLEWHKQG